MDEDVPILPPLEALSFFRAKGYRIGFAWQDVWQGEHARAFTVAKAMSRDLLEEIRAEVDRAIAEGLTLADFKTALRPRLEARGWWGRKRMTDPLTGERKLVQLGSPRRLRTIFQVNMRTAYQAGRWERIQRTKAAFPFLRYVSVMDGRERAEHRAWHGTIKPVDDPWWDSHYPPCGWNCRCTVQAVNARTMARRGWEVTDRPPAFKAKPYRNPRTGEETKVEGGIDPGWSYNVGKAHLDGLAPRLLPGGFRGEAPAGETRERIAAFLKPLGATSEEGRVFTDRDGWPLAVSAGWFRSVAGELGVDNGASAEDLGLVGRAIGGRVFGGWTSIRIDRDIDQVADSFALGVTERWAGHPERWAIEAGAACRVSIGGETVVSGYVDELDSSIAGDEHGISVLGRSRAADLVDCAAVHAPGSWSNRRIEAIAEELAAPFGVTIRAKASTGAPLRKFALQPGETVWEAIGRMLAMRGLLGVSTAEGDIEIVTPEPAGAAVLIEQGRHPVSIGARHNVADRFSSYIVRGQAFGDDEVNGKTAAQPKAEARDPAVKRHRPTILVAEDQADLASVKARATWEATVRAGRAHQVTATLPRWRAADRALWAPLKAAFVAAPAAWVNDVLLVAGVSFVLDEDGRRVELRLARKEAFTQLAIPETAEATRLRSAA